MLILRFLVIILNIILAVITLCFAKPLDWSEENDRAAIVGFGFMIAVYVANVWFIAIL